LAAAVVQEAVSRNLALPSVSDFKTLPGRGIAATVLAEKTVAVLAGNRALMEERGVSIENLETAANAVAAQGKTPLYAALNGKAAGIIVVADVLKKNSAAAVQRLKSMGINTVMLTGDNEKTASAIAAQAGISSFHADVMPENKAAEIRKIKESGCVIAMVGDGINDAPALAQADIGIAIGSGTDVAIQSADIVLMRGDLLDLETAIHLSRRTIRTIKQNLFWAFGYNVLGIPIAAGLLYLVGGPLLNPMFAAAAMSVSSVSVLINALRLKTIKL
jgi:Cu+-exporting ATPase